MNNILGRRGSAVPVFIGRKNVISTLFAALNIKFVLLFDSSKCLNTTGSELSLKRN